MLQARSRGHFFGKKDVSEIDFFFFSNVALPFRWKLFKPYFRCPVPPGFPVQSLMASSQVLRTREDNGVFHITPNMGTLPPHQSVEFILEFAPREVSCSWRKKAYFASRSRD